MEKYGKVGEWHVCLSKCIVAFREADHFRGYVFALCGIGIVRLAFLPVRQHLGAHNFEPLTRFLKYA